MIANSNEVKSREECKFLALLTRTQQKASKITGAARRTFANSNRRNRKISNNRYDKILNAKRSSSNESGSASSGNENGLVHYEPKNIRKTSLGHLSLSSAPTTDNECINSSEEHLYNSNDAWKDFSQNYDWRLPKYVETLETWLQNLEKHPQAPKKEVLGEYKLKVEFLKKVVTTLEEEKQEVESKYIIESHANEEGANIFPNRKSSLPSHRGSPAIGLNRRQNSPDNSALSKPFSVIPHGPASTADVIAKEIHQKLEGRQIRKIRDELFDVGNNDFNDMNQITSPHSNNTSAMPVNRGDNNELDDLLQAHHTAQEKVAEEMLSLTKSLKEQTRVAGEIVRKDTVTIDRSNQLAEANSAKLQVESERLSEHTGSACRCWVWFLLAIVCVTFIAMVMVMKIFSKRKHYEL